MWQDAVGDPWSAEQAVAAAGARPGSTSARSRARLPAGDAGSAGGRRQLLVDLQGLVRTATIGRLETNAHIGDVLPHVEVLKLNDEEAKTLVGSADPEKLRALGVREAILTLGSKGAWVVTRELVEHVPAVPVDGDVDPTGAGDSFSVAYLHAYTRRQPGRGSVDRQRVRRGADCAADTLGRGRPSRPTRPSRPLP